MQLVGIAAHNATTTGVQLYKHVYQERTYIVNSMLCTCTELCQLVVACTCAVGCCSSRFSQPDQQHSGTPLYTVSTLQEKKINANKN